MDVMLAGRLKSSLFAVLGIDAALATEAAAATGGGILAASFLLLD